MEEKSKGKCNKCGPLAECPARCQGRAKNAVSVLVDTDAEIVNRTKEGQGVKTEAENPNDKLQLHHWS